MDMLNMGEDRRVDKLGERHWRIYSKVRKIDGSWGLAVQHRSPALCSLMTQGWDGEERERVQLTKAVTQQRLTPHCKAMIHQFKENTRLEGNGKRKYDLIKLCWESWLSIGKKKNYTGVVPGIWIATYILLRRNRNGCSVLSVTFFS